MLPRRPGKLAACQQVKMNMKDRLAGTRTVVLNHTETGLGITLLASNFTCFSEGIANLDIFLRGNIETVDNMFFRHQ